MQLKTKGIVLHEMPIGEHDKRLVVLTKDYGKLTVFSKGSRRMTSRYLSVSQLFAYSEMVLYQGKSSYNLSSAQLIRPFHHVRDDMEKLAYGMFVLEFTDYVSQEQMTNHQLMQLVLKTLQVLEKEDAKAKLIALIFQLKACAYMGMTPWVTDCGQCSELTDPMYFSSKEGGILCRNHLMVDSKAVLLTQGALHTLQYVIGTDLKHLYNFQLDDETLGIFELVMKQFVLYNLNMRFKTLEFLETKL